MADDDTACADRGDGCKGRSNNLSLKRPVKIRFTAIQAAKLMVEASYMKNAVAYRPNMCADRGQM